MNYNARKLLKELLAAGVPTGGCNVLGVVWDVDGITEIQKNANVKAVLAAHDSAEDGEKGILRKHKDKNFAADLTQAERDELLLAILQRLGMADRNGKIKVL